ncbi:MAG: hypothetical protein ACKVHP_14000 [Verrucomicrobiales bacterium]
MAQGLRASEKIPYQVESMNDAGRRFRSGTFTMQPLPVAGQPAVILLTSDQQNQPMSAANSEKVVATIGQPDAVLFAGDSIDHSNRAS